MGQRQNAAARKIFMLIFPPPQLSPQNPELCFQKNFIFLKKQNKFSLSSAAVCADAALSTFGFLV